MKKLDPKSEEFRKLVDSLISPSSLKLLSPNSPKLVKLPKLPSPKLTKLPKLPSPKLPSPKLPSPKLPSPKLPSPKLPSPKLTKLASPKLTKSPSHKLKSSKSIKFMAENKNLLNGVPDEFLVLDNGAQPFRVSIEGEKVVIGDNSMFDMDGEFPREDKYLNFKIPVENVDEIWLGCGEYDDYYNPSPEFFGNTVLLVVGQRCISVASEIIEFRLSEGEHVTRYISTVGNSAVPYGWIETTLGYYALPSFNCVDNVLFLPNSYEIDYQKMNMGCWETKTYPFKNAKKIPIKF
jgi:hypothetical protein